MDQIAWDKEVVSLEACGGEESREGGLGDDGRNPGDEAEKAEVLGKQGHRVRGVAGTVDEMQKADEHVG